MKSSLRSQSFMEYFSHLPPQEAIQKCGQLRAATEICSDVDNWKAYVAKRYGVKYSLQRPDLTTADEWMKQALALEDSKLPLPPVSNYASTLLKNSTPILGKASNRHPIVDTLERFMYNLDFSFGIKLPGLPIVNSEKTRNITFHVCRFYVRSYNANIQPIDARHPKQDATIFESARLCHQWLLELFMPYYAQSVGLGLKLTALRIQYMKEQYPLIQSNVSMDSLDLLLDKLAELFAIENTAFLVTATMEGETINDQGGIKRRRNVQIDLGYMAAKLSQ